MQNDSWSHVTIDGDGEITLYKDLPNLLKGYDFFGRYGDRITACCPGDFPKSGKLRLTSNKQDTIKVVLRKTTSGSFYIEWGGVRYTDYQKAPCVFTLPQPIVARGKLFRVGV